MKRTSQEAWLDFINSGNPSDADNWLYKASTFRSAVFLIVQEFEKVKDGDSLDNFAISAINAVPYLVGISTELYMKGYLVSQGWAYQKVRGLSHNLPKLREECLKFGDDRFNNSSIKFVTDRLYQHILAEGGVKYPDKLDAPVYIDDFKDALNMLNDILREKVKAERGLTSLTD